MRRILLFALLLSLVTATPAYADPIDDVGLTENALYETGPIPRSTCAEKPISRINHAPTAKAYVTFVARCLDRVWSKQLAKAGVTFKKPKLSLVTKDPRTFCGAGWQKNQIFAYCDRTGTIMIVLDWKMLSKKPDDLYIFTLMGNLYGNHVQRHMGILGAFREIVPNEERKIIPHFVRRLYLQSFCLSGAFTGSVYRSMPRNSADWKFIVRIKGREASWYNGTAKSIAYWMNRGFNTRDPENCNTWVVSDRLVA
ncbi:neutral zinc metallopeptidase [Herbidospora sp. RD11066]